MRIVRQTVGCNPQERRNGHRHALRPLWRERLCRAPVKPVAVVWENGKFVAVEEPKPQKPEVNAQVVEELRSLRAYLYGIEPKMLMNDGLLHVVMQTIHYMAQSDGDAPLGGQVPHFHVSLVLVVRGLIALIDRALRELEAQT